MGHRGTAKGHLSFIVYPGKRFPEGERAIATDLWYSYLYAIDVFKGRFPKGERAIATDAGWSYQYARDILKRRFPEGEKAIATDAWHSYLYAKYVIIPIMANPNFDPDTLPIEIKQELIELIKEDQ